MESAERGGATADLLDHLGRRYAARVRAAVGVVAAIVAPWSMPPAGTAIMTAVACGFVAWTAVYTIRLYRRPAPVCTAVDVAIVTALCVAIPWVDNPSLIARHSGWVIAVAAITVMSVHWHARRPWAWLATIVIASGFLSGAAMSVDVPLAAALRPGLWLIAEGGLSMLVWTLVRRGGRAADVIVAREIADRRAADVAAARRADQRAHWTCLHDTSATTLLMIGNGEVRGDEDWLARQLRRDIAALDGPEALDPCPVDVLRNLAGRLTAVPAAPVVEGHGRTDAPADVAAALVGAASEAVENARRHSGGAAATVRLSGCADRIVVTISDSGRGFDPVLAVRGCGVRWSITERMNAVGGSAQVVSAPGQGTTVRLEWLRV